MTTTPNLRQAARRTIERLLPHNDEGALVDALALAVPGLDWSSTDKGNSLAHRVLRAIATGKQDRPAVRQAQELLCDLLLRDGHDVSASSPIMGQALALGAAWFVLRRHQSVAFSADELATLRAWVPTFDQSTAKRVVSAWSADPGLLSIAKEWEQDVRDNAWLTPGLSAHKIKTVYAGQFSWTDNNNARRFLARRLLPAWLERPYPNRHPEALRVATAGAFSAGGKTLLRALSPELVLRLVIEGTRSNPSPNAPGLLPAWAGQELFGADWLAGVSDPLPSDWLAREVELLRKSQPDGSKEVQAYWRALGYHQGSCGVKALDWSMMMAGEEILSLVNHNATPSRRLVAALTDRLQKDPMVPPAWPENAAQAVPHAIVTAAWITSAPSHLWCPQAADWGAAHVSLDLLGKRNTARQCHGLVAGAILLRILRAQDDPSHWRTNYSLFWSHFLRSDPATLPALLKQIQNTAAPGRPDPMDVTVGDPVIRDALSRVGDLPTLSNPQHDTQFRRVVLELSSRVTAQRIEAARPRM